MSYETKKEGNLFGIINNYNSTEILRVTVLEYSLNFTFIIKCNKYKKFYLRLQTFKINFFKNILLSLFVSRLKMKITAKVADLILQRETPHS